MFLYDAGSLSSGVGELGQQHPLGLCGSLRPAPWQDWHVAPAARGDLQAGKGHRVCKSLSTYYVGCVESLLVMYKRVRELGQRLNLK